MPHLQALVHIERALPAGHDADVQLDLAAGRWRAGNRERPAADIIRQLQVDVLAGLEIHAFGCIEPDPHSLDGGRQILDAGHHARVVLYRQVACILILFHLDFDLDVAFGHCATGQRQPFITLVIHQRETGGTAMVDFAVGNLHLAGATQAVTTGVRKVDAHAQCGIEDGLSLLDVDGLAQRLNGQFVTHDYSPYSAGERVRRPGVRIRNCCLWRMPLSARLRSKSGVQASVPFSHSTLFQSMEAASGSLCSRGTNWVSISSPRRVLGWARNMIGAAASMWWSQLMNSSWLPL